MANTDWYHSVLAGAGEVIVVNNPVLTVAGAYHAADFVGTSATCMTLPLCSRVTGGSGAIMEAVLIDKAFQSASTELWLFDAAVTPPNDNAAWTISDAHAATFLGILTFTTWYASAANSVSNSAGTNPLGFKCAVGSQSLYGCFVTRGTPTYASLDLTVRLKILQY